MVKLIVSCIASVTAMLSACGSSLNEDTSNEIPIFMLEPLVENMSLLDDTSNN